MCTIIFAPTYPKVAKPLAELPASLWACLGDFLGKWSNYNNSNRCSMSSSTRLSWGTEVVIPMDSHVIERGLGKGAGLKINIWRNQKSYLTDVSNSAAPVRKAATTGPTTTPPNWTARKWRKAGAGTQNLRHFDKFGGAGVAQACAGRRRGGARPAQGWRKPIYSFK